MKMSLSMKLSKAETLTLWCAIYEAERGVYSHLQRNGVTISSGKVYHGNRELSEHLKDVLKEWRKLNSMKRRVSNLIDLKTKGRLKK